MIKIFNISIYPSNRPNKFFKKFPFKFYKRYVFFNNYLFKLLSFSKEYFYGNKNDNLISDGCIEVKPLKSNTCNSLIRYIDQILSRKKVKKFKLSKGVFRESITFSLDDNYLKKYLSFNEYSELKNTFYEIKNTIESLGPFSIKPSFIAQKLSSFDLDSGDTNTIMHIDRYVPAVKAFIFLTDTFKNGSSYEFIPYTHLINEKYIKKVLETSKLHFDAIKTINPFSPQISKLKAKKYGFQGQAIISATNGLHRREPFIDKGQFRYTLRFVLYESISLRKVIKGNLKKFIKRL